ncbi:MAG TPA: hypothetical protein VFO48_07905, partial [Vicinamibacterales bacterium]|nr:hypothetical protein [Vicinamibacterales bacterium]
MLVAQEVTKLFQRGRREPQLFERRHAFAVIEDAQHHLLAEQRAQRRDAEVDFRAVLGRDANAAILRQALLGDVHT